MKSLSDLITSLEWGTKLHISVVFLGEHGNRMTVLPYSQHIHKTPACDEAKSLTGGFDRCFRCRNTVLRRVTRTKKPLYGCCVNGIFEYCHPVVLKDEVICVLFIGNIEGEKTKERFELSKVSRGSLQEGFTTMDCRRTAEILEDYIIYLLEREGDGASGQHDPFIDNVKTYIKENLCTDIKMRDLAYFFGYNEKYLGRKFQYATGRTVKEYVNQLRIVCAKELLCSTELKISEISEKVGYNNVTYFNKTFKTANGVTPAEFRKGFREDKNGFNPA